METDAGPSRHKNNAPVLSIQQETDSSKSYLTSGKGEHNVRQPAKDDEFHVYSMRHKHMGKALVINVENFKYMPTRNGTDRDKRHLKTSLERLGFDVKVKEDSTADGIKDTIDKMASTDHSSDNCFVCVFLTHGDDDVVFGSDSYAPDPSTHVNLRKDVFDKFRGESCKSLIGKPKIFIIQACRGDAYEEPVNEIEADSGTTGVDSATLYPTIEEGTRPTIPSGADFLICYSTSQGFFSFRNSNKGSWYISALCEQIRNFGAKEEFTKLLTQVHHQVSQRQSYTSNPETSGKKQMPCFVSMLTKQLFLKPA